MIYNFNKKSTTDRRCIEIISCFSKIELIIISVHINLTILSLIMKINDNEVGLFFFLFCL